MANSPYPGDAAMLVVGLLFGLVTCARIRHSVIIRQYGVGWRLNAKAHSGAFILVIGPMLIAAAHKLGVVT
jgi:hypothetical protein